MIRSQKKPALELGLLVSIHNVFQRQSVHGEALSEPGDETRVSEPLDVHPDHGPLLPEGRDRPDVVDLLLVRDHRIMERLPRAVDHAA